MTGRDLIIYILQHNLEDEPIIKDGKFICFKSIEEVAAELDFGVETIKVLIDRGVIKGEKINGTYYILQ